MTRSKKSLVTDPNQMNLFDLLRRERDERAATRPGRLDIRIQIDSAIKNAIHQVHKSRETLADEMSDLTGERITVAMINNWTSDSHPHEMPGRFYAAFCYCTCNMELARIITEAAGAFVVKGPDALRAEIQTYDEAERQARREKRRRELLLQELEGTK